MIFIIIIIIPFLLLINKLTKIKSYSLHVKYPSNQTFYFPQKYNIFPNN